MQTQCPLCQAVFRVTHQQLSAAGGLVRCGRCEAIFNGNENLRRPRGTRFSNISSKAQSEPYTATASSASSPSEPTTSQEHNPPPRKSFDPASAREPNKPGSQRFGYLPAALYLGFAPAHRRRGAHKGLYAGTALLAVVLPLGAWYVYHARAQWADNPNVKALVANACAYIGCETAPARAPERIEIVDRNVSATPDRSNSLTVAATLVNKAPFPQPFPRMRVSFSDLQGTVVAVHRFQPDEYLSPAHATALMAPDAPVHAKVRIADPGEQAMAFEFAFY